MCQRIFRLVYCSRSRLTGTDAEMREQLAGLLRSARRHNAQAGLTGALFFNTVFFAQVLEGDYVQVQRALERAQRDPRHTQLTILHCGYAARRCFENWSMAFAGASAAVVLPFGNSPRHEAEFTGTSTSGERVLEFLRETVVRQEVWALPERPRAPLPLATKLVEAVPMELAPAL